ncbi:ParB family chromosome partitioning protein [Rhodobacter aestuarii]|uniref:Chromosome partitioning protein, ParB family n=1 Tax=Rhodobacter aestuarii TaxID=453582 RepID=A0A1N7Q2E6_9RHOB|nr:ParB N-terminal domain-containing protein [Rhodobacter aestuarii]PTV94051.1 ParB family chromosome partitioning protein [Rhodobacter aestuarii]SIT17005.1 chromosome partitioning protein, ParB family [Rhodobacter aestuarii]
MTTGRFTEIAVDLIRVPEDRARSFDPDGAAALAGLIEAQGLMHPITVRPHFSHSDDQPAYVLVAGLHRLRAFEQLGRSAIPARVAAEQSNDEARMDEVLENLGRNELTALDRAQHLYELKVVYERMHPEAKAVSGADLAAKRWNSDAGEIFSFASATAEKIGLSKRAIQIAVKIWTGLTPDSRRRLAGTKTATNQSEIKLLSQQSPARQERICDMILSEPPVAGGVGDALVLIERGVRPDVFEKRYTAAHKVIADLDDVTLDRVLLAHEARVIASLKRQGKI